MSRKRYTPEQIIGMLREAEVALSRGEKIGTMSGISAYGPSKVIYDWRVSGSS